MYIRVHVLTSEPAPDGCTMTTVGAGCEVHLMLRGLVDVPREVARLEDKMNGLDKMIAKFRKSMSIEHYEEKVSPSVMVSTIKCRTIKCHVQ